MVSNLTIEHPDEWDISQVRFGNIPCDLCGERIGTIITVRNRITGNIIKVGTACSKQFSQLRWDSPTNYIYSARKFVSRRSDKKLINYIQAKIDRYGNSVRITERDAKRLRHLTGQPWVWELWRRKI